MRIEDYWGVGPKTRAQLEETIGTEAAVDAIESGDLRTLVDEGGLDRGRATRILRRARSAEGMDLLATPDAREVYKEVLELAVEHAVSDEAAARLRTLTPLADRDAIRERLDGVQRARSTWGDLDESTREAVLRAFEAYDEAGGGRRAAAEAAVALHDAGATDGTFAAIGDLDPDALAAVARALDALDGQRVREGADDELDRLRDARATVESAAASTTDLVEELRGPGVRDVVDFREALSEHLRTEADLDAARIREAMPTEAADATGFVGETLTALRENLDGAVEERAASVRADLEAAIEDAEEDLDRATEAVDRVAIEVSLARFADAYDLSPAEYVDREVLAVEDARNLSLLAAGEDVQPVTYALGEHDLDASTGRAALPGDERVTVLTGANSGGKTTLLETLCQVTVLARMGLPVPAERAQVSAIDAVVFHRRHASFNAGVLESTLQSVVPPLVAGDRTLMLVDEFEAITEPGSAADLLNGLVRLTVDEGALGTFVTHLADDLEPLPDPARIDGIVAQGLTPTLELEVDYQPRFGEVGRSTPEFIVSRLIANADDRSQRAGFETLAEALGNEIVQRTLAEAWGNR